MKYNEIWRRMPGGVFVVGGAVRDYTRSVEPKDYDLGVPSDVDIQDVFDTLGHFGSVHTLLAPELSGCPPSDSEEGQRVQIVVPVELHLGVRYPWDKPVIRIDIIQYTGSVYDALAQFDISCNAVLWEPHTERPIFHEVGTPLSFTRRPEWVKELRSTPDERVLYIMQKVGAVAITRADGKWYDLVQGELVCKQR